MVDVYSRPNVFDKKSEPMQNILTKSLSGKCRLPRSLSSWKLRVSLGLGLGLGLLGHSITRINILSLPFKGVDTNWEEQAHSTKFLPI